MTCMAAPSVQVGVRHQREIARALDRRRELALVMGARSSDPRRDDLAVLADEVLQQIDVLVVDPLDLLSGEAAELAALEKLLRALLFALAVAALAFSLAFSEAASTSGWGHVYSPSTNSICVACSKGVLLERFLAARNPVTVTLLPSFAAARSFASRSNATAAISQLTLRSPPASVCTESCWSLNFSTATRAGVYRSASSSISWPATVTRFACANAQAPAGSAGFSSAGLAASLRGASPRGASPGPRTDFAFSSFIIGEGVVQARSIFMIRCLRTASLNLNECSSSPSASASHSMFMST